VRSAERRVWLVCRRYRSAESMALLDAAQDEDEHTHKKTDEEVVELASSRSRP
jgi:hypothetical protein